MSLKHSKRHTESLLEDIVLEYFEIRVGLHLSFPFVEGRFHELEIEGVERILAPKFQLELVFPLD